MDFYTKKIKNRLRELFKKQVAALEANDKAEVRRLQKLIDGLQIELKDYDDN